jgi:hypothetical protein|tara:strand:- start:1098 stop:1880 length:783 start_codon:yes stop_codon:yes gene_type:complete
MVTAQADHYSGLVSFQDIVLAVELIVEQNPTKLYFSKSALDKFEREFDIASKDLIKQLGKDYSKVKRMSTGKSYAVGYFSRFVRKRRLERKEKNELPQLIAEITSFRKSGDILRKQVDDRAIKQNFIGYLLDFVIKLEKMDDTLKNLKTDIERIMMKVLEEAEDTLEKSFKFLKMIQNDLSADQKRIMNQNAVIHQSYQYTIMNYLHKDAWPKYNLAKGREIVSEGKKLISILRQVSAAGMSAAVAEARKEHFVKKRFNS